MFGRRNTVLVISRSLLLQLPMPSDPITPSQVWRSVPALVLNSPVCTWCCRNNTVQIIVEPVFDFIWVGHRRRISTTKAIQHLSLDMTPGSDAIHADIYKVGGQPMEEKLTCGGRRLSH